MDRGTDRQGSLNNQLYSMKSLETMQRKESLDEIKGVNRITFIIWNRRDKVALFNLLVNGTMKNMQCASTLRPLSSSVGKLIIL